MKTTNTKRRILKNLLSGKTYNNELLSGGNDIVLMDLGDGNYLSNGKQVSQGEFMELIKGSENISLTLEN